MKTKQANKLLVLIISVMMIATLFVGLSITASAEETGATTEYTSPAADGAKIYGQSVNLGGDISMKYYVEKGADVNIDDLKLKVIFLGEVHELSAEANTVTKDGYTLYVYSFEAIPPQCMGDTIDAYLVKGGSELTGDRTSKTGYSVKDNLVSTFENSGDSNLKLLILDTLEYGAAAQIYRGYKTNDLVSAPLINLIASDIDQEPPKSSPVVDETVIGSIGKASVHFSTVNYIKITYTNSGTDDVLSSETIAAYDFAKKMEFTVDGLFTLGYSINDYCYDAFNNADTSDNMKALAVALYNYGLSAHIVKGNHEGGTATCAEQAVCTICGNGYGEVLAHNYSYEANDDANTITASCNKGCNYSSVVTLVAPTDPVYNGKVQGATVSGEIKDKEITVTYADDKTPTNAGDYTASITVDTATVSVTYTIAKATPEYTVPTGLTVYVGQTLNDIDLPDGWEWDPDAEPDFVFTSHYAGNKKANAIYTPEDTENYNTIKTGIPFTVLLLPIDGATVTVSGTHTYNGSAITPDVTVIIGEKTLTKNTDYTVSYSDNVNAGTATVTITGKGDYTGKASATFTIAKATPTVTLSTEIIFELYYTGEAQTLINACDTTGGTLQYKVDDGEWSTELPKATNAGTYTVYYKVVGNENYNDVAEQSIPVTINKKYASTAKVELGEYNSVYDGNEKTPTVTVTLGAETLEEGKDYTVTYSNNLYVGKEAKVVITFIGNYEGESTKTFEITQDPNTTEFDGEWVTVPTSTEG